MEVSVCHWEIIEGGGGWGAVHSVCNNQTFYDKKK